MYISTPRPQKRGGGAAITCDLSKFTLTKLNNPIPTGVEVCWGLLKPLLVSSQVQKIIVCSFYSPPNSKKMSKLIDHISTTYHSLKSKHKNAKIMIAGDRNNIKIQRFLDISPTFKNLVNKNTHGNKNLDILVTDLHTFYNEAIILMPVLTFVI